MPTSQDLSTRQRGHRAFLRYEDLSKLHDPKFFAQVEKLLRLRAPIAIGTPEAGGVRILANLVPSRFPLLKRKIDQLEARRGNAVEKYAAKHNLATHLITDDDIVRGFEDAAMELTWKQAVIAVGLENGLVDETGRPLTPRSRRILDKARRRYTRARREFLQNRNAELKFHRLSAGDDQKF